VYGSDQYLTCADFDSYWNVQQRVAQAYLDPQRWSTMVAHNLANIGRFSSDRTIRQYAEEIWGVEPMEIQLDAYDAETYRNGSTKAAGSSS
jgi:glycogen phosphorylase